MRLSWFVLLLVSILLYTCSTPAAQTSDVQAFAGATAFDGDGEFVENAVIVVERGIIKSIGGPETEIPAGAKIRDVSGKFIMPGLVDAHVHFFQTAFFDSRPDAGDVRDSISYIEVQAYQRNNPERYFEAYLRSGITAVYDVGGFNWSVDLQRSAENDLNATHVAAAGVLITPASEQRIATFNTPNEDVMRHLATEEIGRKVVQENSLNGSTGIKIWAMSPNDPDFVRKIEGVADETVKQGNKLIVHATALDQAKLALKLDAKLLVHSVENEEVDDEFITLINENKAVYTPTLIVSRGYYNTYRAVNGDPFEMKDPNQVVDQKTKDLLTGAPAFKRFFDAAQLEGRIGAFETMLQQRDKMMATNLKKLYEAGALIAVGTDAGNPGTVHGISIYDEMEAMQRAGITASDLIVMATKNGAIAMDRLDDFGTLETGKMADMIILNEDPSKDISNVRSITHVIRGGKVRKVDKAFE